MAPPKLKAPPNVHLCPAIVRPWGSVEVPFTLLSEQTRCDGVALWTASDLASCQLPCPVICGPAWAATGDPATWPAILAVFQNAAQPHRKS